MTTIKLVYFAWVREAIGHGEEDISLPAAVKTGEHLIKHLVADHPALAERADALHLAINQEHAPRTATIKDGDEVALFPAVTGG